MLNILSISSMPNFITCTDFIIVPLHASKFKLIVTDIVISTLHRRHWLIIVDVGQADFFGISSRCKHFYFHCISLSHRISRIDTTTLHCTATISLPHKPHKKKFRLHYNRYFQYISSNLLLNYFAQASLWPKIRDFYDAIAWYWWPCLAKARHHHRINRLLAIGYKITS
jgi:hypothetical protein